MKKKIMSIIAAIAVMASGSPLCANAVYTESMTKTDHTDYLKIDFMSDENQDFYIRTGDKKDPENPYYYNILVEEKYSDRVFIGMPREETDPRKGFTIETKDEVSDRIKLLFEDFVTESGNKVTVCRNPFNSAYGYYVTPYDAEKPGAVLELTANDARRIKDILFKGGITADMIYSTDVNSPNKGYTYLTLMKYPSDVYTERTAGLSGEARTAVYSEIKAEAVSALEKYIEDNNLDFTLTTSGENVMEISLKPNYEISFEDHLAILKDIHDKTNIGVISILELAAAGEKFGGVDLMNAVDGDSNCDEQMDMADVVFIMQALANPNKYQLSEQGSFNADLDGNGITVGDAQAIQNKLLGIS